MYLVALCLLACGFTTATSAPEPAPQPAPAPVAAPVAEPATPQAGDAWRVPLNSRMHQHFIHATDATYFVILGDLATAKSEGKALADLDDPDVPAEWRPHLDKMKAAAAEVAAASSIDAAADAVVALGGACADCHAAHEGPRYTKEEVVGSGWGNGTPMQRHHLGAYLMWLGVFFPSDTMFEHGVVELSHEEALTNMPPDADELEAGVHRVAEEARVAKDPATRAEAVATFLKMCAGCHAFAEVELH